MRKKYFIHNYFGSIKEKIHKHDKKFFLGVVLIVSILLLGISWFASTTKKTTNTQAQQVDISSIGGSPVTQGEYPFVVYVTSASGNSWCTGSLISDQWVLTNAHCSFAAQVAVGFHLLNEPVSPGCTPDSTEPLRADERCYVKVVDKIPHPLYDEVNHNYDLMLLKLARKVEHQTISLASDKNLIYNVKYGQLVGYGMINDKERTDIANKLNGEIVYIKDPEGEGYVNFDSDLVYADANNNGSSLTHSALGGDSGGPILSWSGRDKKMYQVSINRVKKSGGFEGASIAHNIAWIREVTGITNFESGFIGKPIEGIERSSYSLGYTCDLNSNSVRLSWVNENVKESEENNDLSFNIQVGERNNRDWDNTNVANIYFRPNNITKENSFTIDQNTLADTGSNNLDNRFDNKKLYFIHITTFYKETITFKNVIIDCAYVRPENDGVRDFTGGSSGQTPQRQPDYQSFGFNPDNVGLVPSRSEGRRTGNFNCPFEAMAGVVYNCPEDHPEWAGCYADVNKDGIIVNTCRSDDGQSEVYRETTARQPGSQGQEGRSTGEGREVSCYTSEYCRGNNLGTCKGGSCKNGKSGVCEKRANSSVLDEQELISSSYEPCSCERYASSSNQSGFIPSQCKGGQAEAREEEISSVEGRYLREGRLICPLGTVYWDSSTNTCVCTDEKDYKDISKEAYGNEGSITVEQCYAVEGNKVESTFPQSVKD